MRYLKNVVSLEYDPEKCTGCMRCVEVCPHAVFAMEDKRAVLIDRDACMECGACVNNCAFDAIRVNAGVGCASAIIYSMLTGNEPTCSCGDSPNGSTCC